MNKLMEENGYKIWFRFPKEQAEFIRIEEYMGIQGKNSNKRRELKLKVEVKQMGNERFQRRKKKSRELNSVNHVS